MTTDADPNRRRTRRPREVRAGTIVDEATRLFAARGFRGTTVAAVASGVGLTDAGVLHHFPTKRDLLAAVLERSTQDQAGLFRDLLAAGGIEALRHLREWGKVMEAAPQFMGLEITLSAEALDPGTELHEFFSVRYRVLHRWLVRVVEAGIERGEIRADVDAAHEVTALIAFLDGIRLQWHFGGVSSLTDRVRTQVDELIARISTVPAPP